MADIKRLLNKKSWTGRELGIIELTNMAVQFRQVTNGEEQKPIVEDGQLKKMVSGIKDRYQGRIFSGYISIHKWISVRFNIAQAQLQQAQLQYRTLKSFIDQAILAEDVFRYVEQLPIIMTEKQYKDAVAAADTVFSANRRAILNGIAIIRASDFVGRSLRIDENGYYVEPVIENSLPSYSLEAFFTESEDYAINVDVVESSRKLLLSSYAYLMGYNYTLDRIAVIHDVPEIQIFKGNLAIMDERIDALNDLVPTLYRRIKDTDYSDKEVKERKLQVLQDFFQPIEYKALAIPEENKAEIDALITDFSAFKNNPDHFLTLLNAIPEDGAGEGA